MYNSNENYPFGRPAREEEEPLDPSQLLHQSEELTIDRIEAKERRAEKRYFSAFRLMIGCMAMLGIIYLIDTFVSIAFGVVSETTEGIIEIIKTMIFTLSGYLFAKKENND